MYCTTFPRLTFSFWILVFFLDHPVKEGIRRTIPYLHSMAVANPSTLCKVWVQCFSCCESCAVLEQCIESSRYLSGCALPSIIGCITTFFHWFIKEANMRIDDTVISGNMSWRYKMGRDVLFVRKEFKEPFFLLISLLSVCVAEEFLPPDKWNYGGFGRPYFIFDQLDVL